MRVIMVKTTRDVRAGELIFLDDTERDYYAEGYDAALDGHDREAPGDAGDDDRAAWFDGYDGQRCEAATPVHTPTVRAQVAGEFIAAAHVATKRVRRCGGRWGHVRVAAPLHPYLLPERA